MPDNNDIAAAWSYHNQTKHSYQSVYGDRHYLDWSNQPIPFKIYPELEAIPLPRDWDDSRMPALLAISELAVQPGSESVPSLRDLASILYFSAGITKQKSYPGGEISFRAASCTGALYEVDLYVVCGELRDLPAGVYHFSPQDFALRRLRQDDHRGILARATAEHPAIVHAPVVIVSTGTYWRNAWKYRARTYRHFGWDNGTILSNLLAMCTALRFPAHLVLGFVDRDLNQLLDLDTEREVALSLVAVGQTTEPVPRSYPSLEPLRLNTAPLSNREVDYPQMRAMHIATSLSSPDEVGRWRGKTPAKIGSPSTGRLYRLSPFDESQMSRDSIEQVVRRRGSSREFQRTSISLEELSTMLRCAAQGIPADFLDPYGVLLNDWYLIVHDVEGLPSGAYVLHRESWQLELLKEGSFRREAGHLGLGQELPADASADVFFLGDLNSILKRFGNRGYRAVQLEAGLLGGKLYLSAYAQRLGATGLTFFDDDVVDFFSPHAKGKSAIFLMAVGHGKKRELVKLKS
jgi:SagB-type dehydrogenase family enzyme